MAGSHINNGIVLVPDSCNLTEDMKEETFLAANYNATTEEEKEEIEKICTGETETEFSKTKCPPPSNTSRCIAGHVYPYLCSAECRDNRLLLYCSR